MTASGEARGEDEATGGGSEFETLASVEELPEGSLLAVRTAAGEEVCLFNYRGRIGAVRNVCTHAEFPLSDGTLDRDGTIECVWHGARFFCLTGEVRRGPAVEPVATYDVRVVDGQVQLRGQRS